MTTHYTTGVTVDGFVTKTREEIEADIQERFRQAFGTSFDMSPESPDGQIIGIVADAVHEAWQRAERSYNNFIPSKAFGVGLDNLVELNGITRIVDRPSTASLDINGTPSGGLFVNTNKWTPDTLPNTTWTMNHNIVLDSNGESSVTVTCDQLGELAVPAGTTWTVSNDTNNVEISTTNPSAAIVGIERETDVELRARRLRSTINKGTSTADAIYEALSALGLEFVGIRENDTNATVDSIPPHCIQVIVAGGNALEIARTIYNNKPAGIATSAGAFANAGASITDSQGFQKDIRFARPGSKNIEVTADIIMHSGATNASKEQIKTDIANFINDLTVGEDVRWSNLFAPLYLIPNIEIVNLNIGELGQTLSQASVDIPFGYKANIDVANITLTEV